MIRVLVVDDSVVIRRLVSQTLERDPDITVVGTAADGRLALAKVEQLDPDVVTLDIEMPTMNGIETVRALRAAGRRMPVIMFSTLTERGAAATLDALTAGATDYVTKPSGAGSVQTALERVGLELVPKIKALVPRATRASAAPAAPTSAAAGPPRTGGRPAPVKPVRAVVVGSSTGGPEALRVVLSALRRPLPVPMLLVQHMPPVFTRQLAERLDREGATRVVESAGGEVLQPGHAYLAPGGRHLEVVREGAHLATRLTDGPPVNFTRPAVDVLFRSAVRVLGGDLLALVLTGMGSDGRDGAGEIARAGGHVVAQDERTSVVWGMPGAVTTAGHAHQVLPLDQVARAVSTATEGARA
ncbi:chemotaxis response regulator protein-glutamate methylesterase [Cellulosimicrobium sp. CUA-896]|uniref:protein-glutamate methylesterase/protein-glutamine glutaminase n=1 Tax=Cellulosimicrobium sp. CUA-896 TaxID=1517881 RepID=UPI00095F44AA|nr:chemotaxis response regulator protein-glutamate methylesterase [Cellulosimicrobium sp. CUA-896]OLT53613.1 chemotaxis response regulator protein-glutamate methylesterase [Cellulosimicrobium sp. CUA-896]